MGKRPLSGISTPLVLPLVACSLVRESGTYYGKGFGEKVVLGESKLNVSFDSFEARGEKMRFFARWFRFVDLP